MLQYYKDTIGLHFKSGCDGNFKMHSKNGTNPNIFISASVTIKKAFIYNFSALCSLRWGGSVRNLSLPKVYQAVTNLLSEREQTVWKWWCWNGKVKSTYLWRWDQMLNQPQLDFWPDSKDISLCRHLKWFWKHSGTFLCSYQFLLHSTLQSS